LKILRQLLPGHYACFPGKGFPSGVIGKFVFGSNKWAKTMEEWAEDLGHLLYDATRIGSERMSL